MSKPLQGSRDASVWGRGVSTCTRIEFGSTIAHHGSSAPSGRVRVTVTGLGSRVVTLTKDALDDIVEGRLTMAKGSKAPRLDASSDGEWDQSPMLRRGEAS